MDIALLGIPLGIVLLYFGSEWMVSGAQKIAILKGISPFVIGLTVLAFGSSAPEAFTSIVSTETPDIIIGNVVGSNIVNIGVALGLSAILSTLYCSFKETRIEFAFMVLSALIVFAMALTGSISRPFGIILVALIFIFIYIVYRTKRDEDHSSDEVPETVDWPMWKCILVTLLGLVMLYFGSDFFVEGSIVAAGMLGISELLVGLIIVAIGTSLPEICISLMAAYKGEAGMAISNVVGSSIFNCFFVLGIGASLVAVPVSDSIITIHLPMMLLMTVLLCAFIYKNNKLGKVAGATLLALYIAYVVVLALNPALSA
jgi:cation:H+ antiporter